MRSSAAVNTVLSADETSKSNYYPKEILVKDDKLGDSNNSTESENDASPLIPFLDENSIHDTTMPTKKSLPSKRQLGRQSSVPFHDDTSGMTYARKIAEKLGKYSWYYPHNDPPNDRLKRAWEYFEHAVLPRYVDWEAITGEAKPNSSCMDRILNLFVGSSVVYEKARSYDKNPTKLYPAVGLGLNQMQGFGIGIFLYFKMMKCFIGITLFAGLLNISSMQYFGSPEYDSPKILPNIILRRSAICNSTVWVPCRNCSRDNYSDVEAYRWGISSSYKNYSESEMNDFTDEIRHRNNNTLPDHIITSMISANSTNSTNQTELFFSLRNDCGRDFFPQGISSLCTILMIVIGVLLMDKELRLASVAYDEEEQTAQDYSIIIKNPPFDANDPEEWKEFFSHFDGAEATCCTISFNNDLLVCSLKERRETLKHIEMKLPPGTSLEDNYLAKIAAEMEEKRPILQKIIALFFHPFGLLYDVPALYARLVVLTAKIKGITQREYLVTRVYITFETEEDQRNVLSTLAVPVISAMFNAGITNREHLFRGALVLRIEEAPEPEVIRWENLNTDVVERLKLTVFINTISFLMIYGIYFGIYYLQKNNSDMVPSFITIMNILFPLVARSFSRMEKHETETNVQSSLFFKTLVFRLVTTVIILYIITPFTSTLEDDGIILTVQKIFISEIVTVNALAIIDPFGHVQRHIIGPRQTTQDRMNRSFLGKPVMLAERYTTQAKLLILSATYFVLFPQSLLLCACALMINYNVDKFCMLFNWSLPARLEATTSKIFRQCFSPLLFFTLALTSAYWWTGFPFDNLCPTGYINDSSKYIGNHIINTTDRKTGLNITIDNVIVNSGDNMYSFCNQDMLSSKRFPPFPYQQCRKQGYEEDYEPGEHCEKRRDLTWMTEEQEKVALVFGWFLTVMTVLSSLYLLRIIWKTIQGYFQAQDFTGDDQGIPFSSVNFITTYIPQVASSEFSYPLLACSIDEIDTTLMTWTDPHKPYSFYSLLNDAQGILGLDDDSAKKAFNRVFDRVKHWPQVEE